MRHASARNVVERIFGVIKRRFRILDRPLEYDMRTQALIPAALAALHNFIREYDPQEIRRFDDEGDDDDDDDDYQLLALRMGPQPGSVGELGGQVTPAERARANEMRDNIASAMWEQYQRYLRSAEC